MRESPTACTWCFSIARWRTDYADRPVSFPATRHINSSTIRPISSRAPAAADWGFEGLASLRPALSRFSSARRGRPRPGCRELFGPDEVVGLEFGRIGLELSLEVRNRLLNFAIDDIAGRPVLKQAVDAAAEGFISRNAQRRRPADGSGERIELRGGQRLGGLVAGEADVLLHGEGRAPFRAAGFGVVPPHLEIALRGAELVLDILLAGLLDLVGRLAVEQVGHAIGADHVGIAVLHAFFQGGRKRLAGIAEVLGGRDAGRGDDREAARQRAAEGQIGRSRDSPCSVTLAESRICWLVGLRDIGMANSRIIRKLCEVNRLLSQRDYVKSRDYVRTVCQLLRQESQQCVWQPAYAVRCS